MRGGGAERVALTLIEEFLRRGHEVDLVLMSAAGELLGLVPRGVRVFNLNAPRTRNALTPIIRYLRDRRPVAIQASMWPLTVAAIAAARLSGTGTRIVASEHSVLSHQYGKSVLMSVRATMRLLYPLADARIAVSKGTAQDLASLSGLWADDFTVVYNPIPAPPPGALESNPEVEALWRGANRRILTVGTLKAEKNHSLLLESFAMMPMDEDLKLMILGDGELRGDLERQSRALGLQNRVIMPGFSHEPWPYYASANVFVLSSDYEGFGNVIVEAMHAGLPVVSTDCPAGPAEILEDGRSGILVPPGDKQRLADAMCNALSEPRQSERQKRRAADFSVAAAADRYQLAMLGHSSGKTP